MEGGLEGAWRGQRDRGRGACPKGGREGKNKLGERGGICRTERDSLEQAEREVRCKRATQRERKECRYLSHRTRF